MHEIFQEMTTNNHAVSILLMKWPVTAHTHVLHTMYMHYIQWMMFAVTLLVVHYSWPACD